MANTQSSKKRIRTNSHKHIRNQMYRSRVKTVVKKAETAIFSGNAAEEDVRAALQKLDKAAGKGILHKNNAARRKSRLMKKYNKVLQQAAA